MIPLIGRGNRSVGSESRFMIVRNWKEGTMGDDYLLNMGFPFQAIKIPEARESWFTTLWMY